MPTNTAGFCGAHRDAALREVVQPPLSSEQQDDDRDPDPCPSENEELFQLVRCTGCREHGRGNQQWLDGFPHSTFETNRKAGSTVAAGEASKEHAAETRQRRKAGEA